MDREREIKVTQLCEFGQGGGLKAFNPIGYLEQMCRVDEFGRSLVFEGLEKDLEAVVAETLMEAELRKISFKTRIDEGGKLVWLAPGHEGGEGGDVLKMADLTVERYRQMSRDASLDQEKKDRALAMAERFWMERQQTEKIIKALSLTGEGEMVMAILPDNEVVYPVTQVNYLTVYRLETDKEGTKIVSYPLMNRYSNRAMSVLAGGKELSEAEILLGVKKVDWTKNPQEVFEWANSLTTNEERKAGLMGSIVDRTQKVEDCKPVIETGRMFLEEVLKLELKSLIQGGGLREISSRLEVAWELVVKNMMGYLSGEKYLSKTEMLEKILWYTTESLLGFSRQRFLRAIVDENDLQILNQPLVKMGACGSLGFGGLGEVPFGASSAEWQPGICVNPSCRHGGNEVMVGPCSICAECEKVL